MVLHGLGEIPEAQVGAEVSRLDRHWSVRLAEHPVAVRRGCQSLGSCHHTTQFGRDVAANRLGAAKRLG